MLLTIKEAAERLRISVSLTYRLVAAGEIPCVAIASCKRIDEDDLLSYVQSHKLQTPRVPRGMGRHF